MVFANSCGVRVEEGEKMSEVLAEMGQQDRLIRLEYASTEEFQPSPELQQFEILDHILEDSILAITVQYGGGCKAHPFYAIFVEDTGGEGYSGTIFLEDPETTDYCRSLITEKIRIDIGELIRARPGKSIKLNDYKALIKL